MKEIHVEIGNRIRKIRTKKGLSQEKLAELSNLNTSYIGQVERGEKNPSVETIYSITTALGVSIQSLFENISSADSSPSYANQVYSLMISMDERQSKALYEIALLLSEGK